MTITEMHCTDSHSGFEEVEASDNFQAERIEGHQEG